MCSDINQILNFIENELKKYDDIDPIYYCSGIDQGKIVAYNNIKDYILSKLENDSSM